MKNDYIFLNEDYNNRRQLSFMKDVSIGLYNSKDLDRMENDEALSYLEQRFMAHATKNPLKL